MRGCEWCDYKETEWLLYQSLYWSVYLADRQDYIGRCILVLNRHCGSLSELDISEWTELKTMIDRLERLYKEVLGAELCNWSCLLNDFYKEAVPNPHLHIHVRPRYKKYRCNQRSRIHRYRICASLCFEKRESIT